MKTEHVLIAVFALLLMFAPKKSRRYIRNKYKKYRSKRWKFKRSMFRKKRRSISRKSFLRGLRIGKMRSRKRYKLA